MPSFLIVLLAAAAIATANVSAFEVRILALEGAWHAAEAAGVPAGSLTEARREVAVEQGRRVGVLPYPVVSGAVLRDPFQHPEASADAAVRTALDASRQRAAAALARWREAAGPNGDVEYDNRLIQLYQTRRPVDLDRLAQRWQREAASQAATGQRL